ncbi:hypothetical protein Bbelb_338360 [Branchiostoma belcheri]|nr:hypothetical protein Bbelb_338360 [Branchiostoma belcheri]
MPFRRYFPTTRGNSRRAVQTSAMETDIVAGAEGGEHALGMKVSGIEAKTRYVPLSFAGTTTVEMEAHLDPSPVLQKGKPTEQPAAAATRSMYWNPYCKRLETGWYMGRWKSDQRRCLYHLQTSTAVSLIAGDDVGTFGIRWTADSEPMVLDIDNVDFCVDHNAIVTNGSLDNPDLEATIGEKLRVVLTGRKLPAEELKFKPARIYNDTETSQLVAIVGSPEHSNAENIKHVLVAEVTDSGNIAAADISKITKAKKEHLVRVNGRCCNEEKLLADIRRIYFPSFATGSQQPLWKPMTRDWVNMTSPAGDLCLGNLLQDYYIKEQKNEQRTNESDGKSSSSTFDTTTSNERNQMEQQVPGSQQENENSKKLSDIQEENNRLQQELHNSKDKNEKLARQLIESQEKYQILKEQLLESEWMSGLNFELWWESQQETRALTEQLEDSREENQTLTQSLSENQEVIQTFNQRLLESQQESQALNELLLHSREENQDLSQQLSDSNEKILTLKQQVADSNEKIQTLKQQVADSNDKIQTLKQQVADSNEKIQTLKQQVADSNDKIQTLKQQVADSNEKIQTLKQQVANSSKENQTLKQQVSDSSKENQTLKQQVADSSKENQTLKQQVADSNEKIQTLTQNLVDSRQETQTVNQRLSNLNQLLSYIRVVIQTLHHRLLNHEDQRQSLQEQLSTTQALCSHQYHLILLLNWFLSFARPVQRLIVRCFKHYQDWSSLCHEKNCFECRIFQQG